jgi:hypothetical protein
MSTGTRVNQPYNFSYGVAEEPEEKPRNIDPGFIAGMAYAINTKQPYNYAYGKSDSMLFCFLRSTHILPSFNAAGMDEGNSSKNWKSDYETNFTPITFANDLR